MHRPTTTPRSPADGHTTADLAGLPGDTWITFIARDGQLVPDKGGTPPQARDEVLILAPPNSTTT